MYTVTMSIGRAIGGLLRAVRWSFMSVEDEPAPRYAPAPGPAHGPVSAIDVRRGKARSV